MHNVFDAFCRRTQRSKSKVNKKYRKGQQATLTQTVLMRYRSLFVVGMLGDGCVRVIAVVDDAETKIPDFERQKKKAHSES